MTLDVDFEHVCDKIEITLECTMISFSVFLWLVYIHVFDDIDRLRWAGEPTELTRVCHSGTWYIYSSMFPSCR